MWLLFCCIFQLKNPAICLKCCKKNFLIQNLMSIFAFWRLNSPFSLFEWHFIGPSSLILQTWNWHSAVDKDLAFPCTSPNLLYGKWLRTCWQRKIFQWPILHSGILYGKTGNDIGHRHVKSSIFVTQSRNKNCKVQSFLGCNYSFQCIQRRMTVFRPRDTLSAQSWRVNCGEKIENSKFVCSFGRRFVNICQRAMKYMPNRGKFSQLQWNWRIFSRTSYGFWATPHIRAACWGENCSKKSFLSISAAILDMLTRSK